MPSFSEFGLEAGEFFLMSVTPFSSQWWKACSFQSFGGRGKKRGCPKALPETGRGRVGEGLVNSLHRIIHNLYYKDTEYSLDSF